MESLTSYSPLVSLSKNHIYRYNQGVDGTIKTTSAEDREGADSRMEIGLLPPHPLKPLGRVGWKEEAGTTECMDSV